MNAKATEPPSLVLVPGNTAFARASDLWWLNPVAMTLLGILPVYIAVLLFGFSRLLPVVYVPGAIYFFGVVLILAFAAGAQWAISLGHAGQQHPPPRISSAVMWMLLLPALGAYAVWFGPLLVRWELLVMILTGERNHLRDDLSILTGVTSFTQFGVAYVIAYGLKSGAGGKGVSRGETVGFILICLLAMLRAITWAERLALIEVGIGYLVARLACLPIRRPGIWKLASIGPVFGAVALYLVFTASEYVRSWEYYVHQYSSVWAFTLDRLIAYYATGVNNGVGLLTEATDWPHYRGAFPFNPFFRMPGLGPLLTSAFGEPPRSELAWIQVYGNPEFNTFTAYFMAVLDLGYAGAVALLLALGYFTGRAYVGFRSGSTFGLLSFGPMVIFIGESLRYNYLTETRIVAMVGGLLMLALDMRRLRGTASRTLLT